MIDPNKGVWKKIYKPYSTKLVKFFTWERIPKNDRPIKKGSNRRTSTEP